MRSWSLEMSRAERAAGGRGRLASEINGQFPLSCPQAAPPRRGGAIGRSSIVATLERESLFYSSFAFPLISCQPRLRLGTRPAARRACGNPLASCLVTTRITMTVRHGLGVSRSMTIRVAGGNVCTDERTPGQGDESGWPGCWVKKRLTAPSPCSPSNDKC